MTDKDNGINEINKSEINGKDAAPALQSAENPDKKYNLFKLILIVINIITIIILINIELKDNSLKDFSGAMSILSSNIIWLLIGLAVFVVKNLADTLCYFILIKYTTGENRFILSLKTALIGKYGDGVTPLATGGQPFQIYLLHKYNVELAKSASIPLTRIVIKVLAYDLTMLFFFIFFPQKGSGIIKAIAYVGIGVNMILPVVIILFTVKVNWARKMTAWGLKLGYKLRLVKDIDKERDYWTKKVDDMLSSIRYFTTHPFIFFSTFALSAIELLALSSIPFFVYKAFGGGGYGWLFVTVSTMYVLCSSLMSPTPGTSGAAEASFYLVFAKIITGGMVFYGLITWRIITFYSYIFIGILLLVYESFFKKKSEIDISDEKRGRTTNRMRRLTDRKNKD
ncbi:MAG: lysylphosphatidylglycerol synthase transmembrane domain-containing protein [Christensenellales bacterium]|jgi:uncharacterized protein (TIRG00374 family)